MEPIPLTHTQCYLGVENGRNNTFCRGNTCSRYYKCLYEYIEYYRRMKYAVSHGTYVMTEKDAIALGYCK